MMSSPRIQSLLSTEGDGLFVLSLHTDDVGFEMIEMTSEEIRKLLDDIKEQLDLLEEADG
ncbi:hypothetical protein ES707_10083 [subsurface metagenome]